MHRIVRRAGLPAFIIASGAMLALVATSLILAVGYRDQFSSLKRAIYTRCQQREAYDRASQQSRVAQADYYRRLIVNLRRNAHGSEFDVDLTRSARRALAGLDVAVATGAPRGCAVYR